MPWASSCSGVHQNVAHRFGDGSDSKLKNALEKFARAMHAIASVLMTIPHG